LAMSAAFSPELCEPFSGSDAVMLGPAASRVGAFSVLPMPGAGLTPGPDVLASAAMAIGAARISAVARAKAFMTAGLLGMPVHNTPQSEAVPATRPSSVTGIHFAVPNSQPFEGLWSYFAPETKRPVR